MNNFDFIAPYYDRLAKVVFGNAIKRSQLEFISFIPSGAHVLIIGGGTGWIIEAILEQSEGVSIVYLEKSNRMIESAKKKIPERFKSNVIFINDSFENFKNDEHFDVVICNFFLDLFPIEKLKSVLFNIKQLMKGDGLLLVADFQIKNNIQSKLWQKPMMILMHLFFRVTASLESKNLNSINLEILKSSFRAKSTSYFFHEMIFSSVYSINEDRNQW